MSARQNKKAVHPYHHPRSRNTRERERTVTTLTDSAFISDTSTTTRATTLPTNTSIPASLGTPTINTNHHSANEYTTDAMIPNLLSSPDFLAALQNTYGNGFYNNQNHEHYDPQDPNFAIHANYQPSMPLHNGNMYMQPAEPSDLAILEDLKATIKEGQHPMFRPEPRPAVLRALWQGAHPDSGLQEPAHDKGKGREKLTEQPDGPTNEISMAAPSPSQRNGLASRGSVSSNTTHPPPLSASTSKQPFSSSATPKSDDKPPLLEPNDRDHSSRHRDSQRHSNAPARYDREDAADRDREKERDRERRLSTADERRVSSTRPSMDDRHYEPPPPSSVSEYSRRPLDDRRPLHFEDRERERERRPMLEERDRRPSVDRRPLPDDRERRSSAPTPAPASSRVDDRRDDRDRRPLPTRVDDRRVPESRKPLQDERRPVLLDDRPLPVDTSRVVDEKRPPIEDRRVQPIEDRRPPVDEHRLPAVDVRRPLAEDRRPPPPHEDRRDDRRPVATDRGSLDDRRLVASDERRLLDDRHPVRPLDDHRPLPPPPPVVDRRALVDDRRPPPASAPPTSSPAGSADASRPIKLEERISRVPTLRERLKTPPHPPLPAVVAPQAAIPLEQRITGSEDPIPRTQSTATNVPPPTTTSPPTRSYNRPASPTRASYTRPASVHSRSPPPPRTAYRVPPVPNNYRPGEIERDRERERELREREREKERIELSSSGRFSPPTAADLARDRDRMRRKFTPPPLPAPAPVVFEGERRREWSANGMWDDDYYKREAERRYVPAPSPPPRAAYAAPPPYVVAPTLRRGRSPSPVIPVKRAREEYDYGARYRPHDPYPDYVPHVSYERPRSPPPPLGYDRARAYERDRSGRYLPPSNR